MASKEPQAPILALPSQPVAARHHVPLPPVPPLGPTHRAMQGADPNTVGLRFGLARPGPGTGSRCNWGAVGGGPGTPSVPS